MIVTPDGVVWDIRPEGGLPRRAIPPPEIFNFMYQPLAELYTYVVQLFSDWPSIYNGQLPQDEGMAISSWWRASGQQSQLVKRGIGAVHSQHLVGTAFDIIHPDGLSAYLTMGDHADNYWGGFAEIVSDDQGNVLGSNPRLAAAQGRTDGYWTADYSERDLHFHVQRFTGNTPEQIAWFQGAQDAGLV